MAAPIGALAVNHSGGGQVYNDNRVTNLTSREALEYLTHTIRDADVVRYATRGVH